MANTLRVGIIGASPRRGWAKISHVPAVQQLPGLELAAVAGRDQATADATARAFGAARGFADAGAMARDPGVDLVTVTVKVPDHRALVLAALAAGKHVYCEWPLGRDVAEAEELRDAAAAAGVHAVIGLQARHNPALRRARALLADGAVGRVLSAHLASGTVAFGPRTDPADFYLEDPANGATHVSIHAGHAVDAAVALLGGLADLATLAAIQYAEVAVEGEDRVHRRTIPDLVLTQSRVAAGGVLSAEVAGGRPMDTTFRFEVVGDRGVLALDGAAPRGFQSGRLTLSLDGTPQPVDEGELAPLPDAACNVGGVYAALRDDVARGTRTVADFGHAVALHRLVADLERAGSTGSRADADGWPNA
ncbi:oxidoreductase [Gemmatimonadetes bacterium T265]|nr:oxidoreductase [Gemmatimonadetes bacterium T265]